MTFLNMLVYEGLFPRPDESQSLDPKEGQLQESEKLRSHNLYLI